MAVKTNAKQFLESLVAGDMITFHSQTATHWGIYVGDKKVVHLTGEAIANSSDQSEALFTVAGKQYTKAAVKEDDFLDVAEAFDKYERNCKDIPKMTPDDPEDIVELAKTMVGNIYYNEMWNSCKKLAIYCRYDLSNLSGTGDENDEDNEVDEDNEGGEDNEDDEDEQILRACQTPMTAAPWGADQVPMNAAPLNIPDVKLSKRREFITRHNKETIKELEKGDLVTFKRKWYYHWAVYIGPWRNFGFHKFYLQKN